MLGSSLQSLESKVNPKYNVMQELNKLALGNTLESQNSVDSLSSKIILRYFLWIFS